MKLRFGDPVKVILKGTVYEGVTGTVVKGDRIDDVYVVQFLANGIPYSYAFSEKELEKVDKNKNK